MKTLLAKNTLIVLLLASQLSTFAQLQKVKDVNSYYLGKRNAVGVTCHFYPTTYPTRFSEERSPEDPELYLSFISSPEFSFSRATNNNTSIQLSYSKARLHAFNEVLTQWNEDRSQVWRGASGNIVYNKNSFGFHFNKHFAKRGNLAPIGNHIKYGFRFNSYRNRFNGITLPAIQGGTTDFSLEQKEQTILFVSIDLGYTYRSMISENLYFDLSVFGGIPLRITPDLYDQETVEERLDYELFELGRERLRFATIGAFGLGVGKVF